VTETVVAKLNAATPRPGDRLAREAVVEAFLVFEVA
jgi:hypothetical protein